MSAPERRPVVVADPSYDALRMLLGKLTSLTDLCLLSEDAGKLFSNAPAAPGAVHQHGAVWVDFADAGIDQVRVCVRGNAGAAGTVQVTVHDRTNNVELARVALSGAADSTVAGAWTRITPTGEEQEIELRVIGDGALDPVLFRGSLQCRTLQARP